MNTVNICGKIQNIKEFDKVIYLTVHCKDSRNNEFLDVTIFDKTFFNRYFIQGMWIGILGHLHKNKYKDYKQEIIADSLYFVGDVPTPTGQLQPTTDEFKDIEIDKDTGEIPDNIFPTLIPEQAVSGATPMGKDNA